MSPLDSPEEIAAIDPAAGRADGGRRLSDKILAAFNHAYAVGELEVAGKLRAALAAACAPRPGGRRRDQRAPDDPLGHAERWVAFVDARNRYKELSRSEDGGAAALAEALGAMKDAYRAWSTH